MPADMNHIIHGCSHPKWRDTAYGSEQEIFNGIQEYLDRLIRTCRQGRLGDNAGLLLLSKLTLFWVQTRKAAHDCN